MTTLEDLLTSEDNSCFYDALEDIQTTMERTMDNNNNPTLDPERKLVTRKDATLDNEDVKVRGCGNPENHVRDASSECYWISRNSDNILEFMYKQTLESSWVVSSIVCFAARINHVTPQHPMTLRGIKV